MEQVRAGPCNVARAALSRTIARKRLRGSGPSSWMRDGPAAICRRIQVGGMHELAVTQSVLEIALRHATKAGGRRITNIHLAMGELSTNLDESVQFYWDILAQGTAAEGATLHFRRVPALLQCRSCEAQYPLAGGELACPECGHAGAKILAGEEFSLEAIDVDERGET